MNVEGVTVAAPQHVDDRLMLLAVAGLLHDIGKVLEPTGTLSSPELCGLEKTICSSHRHALFTAEVLRQVKSNFGGLDRALLSRAASNHHRPADDELEEQILAKANWIANGHDQAQSVEGGFDSIRGFEPIASYVDIYSGRAGQPCQTDLRLPTGRLSFDSDRFLPHPQQKHSQYINACADLVNTVIAGLSTDFNSASQCLTSIDALMSHVAHAVPNNCASLQQLDVDLYDHSRVVAAFAVCLGALHTQGHLDAQSLKGRYRLAGYSIGGIQRFIFRDLSPADSDETGGKGRAKRLRARSFYVSALSQVIARRLCAAAGVPHTNTLIDAGGRSLLLLPDIETVTRAIYEESKKIQHMIWEQLGGVLGIDFAVSNSLFDKDFLLDRFSRTYSEMADRMRDARTKSQSLPSGPKGWSDDGWILPRPGLPIDSEAFRDTIQTLGERLHKATHLSFGNAAENASNGLLQNPINVCGWPMQIFRAKPKIDSGAQLAMRIGLGGDDDSCDAAEPMIILANHVPVATKDDIDRFDACQVADQNTDDDDLLRVGETLTFGHLSCLSVGDDGEAFNHPMLGVLKADVDRLGMVMAYGLRDSTSIARLASLSRSLDLFFKGFLTARLCAEHRHVYTVYSGGDDLLLIGPWFDLTRFARDLNRWFTAHTCDNPELTLSAGLVYVQPHAPVRQIASAAAAALDQAKSEGRNRITHLGASMQWEEFERAFGLLEHLRAAERNTKLELGHSLITSSLVYRLLQYSLMATRVAADGEDVNEAHLKWRAQMSYDLTRNAPIPDPKRAPESAESMLVLHRALMNIRTADDAAVLRATATWLLYQRRGGYS